MPSVFIIPNENDSIKIFNGGQISMPSGFFYLPNQYDSIKIFNDGQKRKKNTPQETDSEMELHRESPSEQEWLKHILVALDAVPVSIRYAWKQRCFNDCFHDSTSQYN